MKSHKLYIGTSGWSYKHWQHTFYPEDLKQHDQLEFYQRNFNTVEINNSFYRLPEKETFRHWHEKAPVGFIYAVKASRYITHNKRLKDPKQSLETFLEHAATLKEKLGPVLFQLPPNWKPNIDRLQGFLEALPEGYRYVLEFRDPRWYTFEVFSLLRKFNCAFCIYELAGHKSPEVITADFVYIRLHGPGAKYEGSYTDKALAEWKEKCDNWKKQGDVFIYFDNDQNGYAAFNARTLQDL